jgi:hypothetical protein
VAIDRTNWTALIDDDGSNTTGTLWTKDKIKTVLLDPIDAALIAPGGQIAFPATQNPSANANTLDDYEEGKNVWSPVIGGASGTSGQTYSSQIGNYIKIGQLVMATFDMTLTAKGTITGVVQIQGLPFLVSSATGCVGTAPVVFSGLATSWVGVNAFAGAGATVAYLVGNTAAATSNFTNLAAADISNTTRLLGCVVYIASA